MIVSKTYLPSYNEFYEKRWFASGRGVEERSSEPRSLRISLPTWAG